MKDKVIEIATERKLEDNLKSIGAEYWNSTDQTLAIYGAIDEESKILTLVIRPEAQQVLLDFVDKLNREWYTAQSQKGV